MRDHVAGEQPTGAAPSADIAFALWRFARCRYAALLGDRAFRLVGIDSIGGLIVAVRCNTEQEYRYVHDSIAGLVP